MSNGSGKDYVVTIDHMTAFGAIIQWFARIECLMQGAMAGIVGMNTAETMMLTATMGYSAKKDTLQSLLKLPHPFKAHVERINWFLGEVHKYNGLRNYIAHSMWIEGKRPDSIKPMSVIVRGGSGKYLGIDEEERDYLFEELIVIADELSARHDEFQKFLRANGILRNIDRNTEPSSSETSPSEGKPSAK